MKVDTKNKRKTAVPPRRKQHAHDPFLKFVGAFPAFKSIDEINAWVRDMREDRNDHEKQDL